MSNVSQGFSVGAPNAENIARRRLQLEEWQGSDTNRVNLALHKKNLIQFKRKFMFLDSVIQHDAEEVQRLLALGVDVNYTNTDGISALHQVCIDGNAEIAEILLANNPNINAPDNDGWTPLHAAAQCGYTDLARLLLEAGADVACVDNEGHLPIDKAEEDDDMRQLLATWMRRKAIDIEQVRTAEERALRDAADRVIRNRTKELDIVTVDGATILHCAAAKGIPDVINTLARAGISMNIQDYDGWTPLHAAARWAQPEAIDALIDNGADIHIVNNFAENPLDTADEDVLDMLKEYYDRKPARSRPVVPGVEKFIRPKLPDRSEVQSIMKGSRRARENNKENRPEKLPRTEEPKKEEPVNDVAKPRSRLGEPAAAVENKPGPAIPAWQQRRKESANANDINAARNKRVPVVVNDTPAPTPPKKALDVEPPQKRPSIPTINTDDSTSDKPEVVRKAVSRRKREERRPTQAVTADDIPSAPPKEEKKEAKKEEPGPPTLVVPSLPNGPTPSNDEDKKPRHTPVTVSISDSGAVVWDSSKKSPENETPSPVSQESASDKAEIVRKKVARRKRDERRSTQHVSKDDLPGTPDKDQPEPTPEPPATSNKDKEDHLAKELELERKRYNESAEALARNQEDLRKREVKITSLEKENENMKKKIADLEEDLRRLQQVNSDNQRLRDENAALIRVIGKLSRNPL